MSLNLWPYIVQALVYIKNRTYNPIINKAPYKALIGSKPNIAYIRILGSLAYTLIPKEKRISKLDNKVNKGILVRFKSSNNFLVYILSLNKVISTKDILIKEDLDYKDDYITKDNYDIFLKELEINKGLEPNTSLDLSNIDSNIEDNTIESNIEDNSESEGEEDLNPNRANSEISDLDELNSEYYNNNNSSIRTSKRLRGETPNSQGLSIYKLASQAYYTSLEVENIEGNKDNKIILSNNPNIIEPLDYKE